MFKEKDDNDKEEKAPQQIPIADCWFCRSNQDISDWYFSFEFDCFLHEECLKDQIKEYKERARVDGDRELEIIAEEIYGKDFSSVV